MTAQQERLKRGRGENTCDSPQSHSREAPSFQPGRNKRSTWDWRFCSCSVSRCREPLPSVWPATTCCPEKRHKSVTRCSRRLLAGVQKVNARRAAAKSTYRVSQAKPFAFRFSGTPAPQLRILRIWWKRSDIWLAPNFFKYTRFW